MRQKKRVVIAAHSMGSTVCLVTHSLQLDVQFLSGYVGKCSAAIVCYNTYVAM